MVLKQKIMFYINKMRVFNINDRIRPTTLVPNIRFKCGITYEGESLALYNFYFW